MFTRRFSSVVLFSVILVGILSPALPVLYSARPAYAQNPAGIPEAAWSRPIGQPVQNPSRTRITGYETIDDGPVQGAPLGGFGAGTFSRTYAGDFARWHMEHRHAHL